MIEINCYWKLGTTTNMNSFFDRICHSRIPRLAAVALVAVAWSSPAICDEIHDAAKIGALGRVKALLEGNPDLAFSKDNTRTTPLHFAAYKGHKDVVQLLREHGGHE